MTRDEILKMPPGSELDLLVAREVMQYQPDPQEVKGGWVDLRDGTCIPLPWSPSTNLDHALTVLGRVGRVEGLAPVGGAPPSGAYTVTVYRADGSGKGSAKEARLPVALCRAALLSVMKLRD